METGNHIYFHILYFYIFYLPLQHPLIIEGVQMPRRKNIITSCSYVQTWKTLQTWIFQVFLPPAQVHNADRGKNVAEFGIK